MLIIPVGYIKASERKTSGLQAKKWVGVASVVFKAGL